MNNLALVKNKLIFTNDTLPDSALREIGARKGSKANEWSLPPIYQSIALLERLNAIEKLAPDVFYKSDISADKSIERFYDEWGFFRYELKDTDYKDVPDNFYSYQTGSASYLVNNPHHGCMLCLAPGLGKTITSITALNWLKSRHNIKNVLIVCPLNLIPTWIEESKKWGDVQITGCYGELPGKEAYNVTNFDTVMKYPTEYASIKWDVLIIDESIEIKNRKSKRFKTLLEISKKSDKVWLLTGAPISKHADDLYAQLHLMNPSYFNSYWRFVYQYCHVEHTVWGDKVTGTKEFIDLKTEFKDLIHIVTHEETDLNLPEPYFETIYVDLPARQRKMYDEIEDAFITMLSSDVPLQVNTRIAQMVRLQQIVSNTGNVDENLAISGKTDTLLPLIENGSLALPAIIWCNWRKSAELLFDKLCDITSCGIVIGGGKYNNRVIKDYKDGKINILVASLGTMSYGHTLIDTKTIVYYDRIFDGNKMNQSVARVVGRIGLKHNPIILTLKARNTIDELLDTNLSSKIRSIATLTNQDLSNLIKGMYSNEYSNVR